MPDDSKFTALEKRICSIEEVIRGDIQGTPGLMQLTKQMVKDLYNEQQGALARLARLEVESIRFKGAAWGVKLAGRVFWGMFGGAVLTIIAKALKFV